MARDMIRELAAVCRRLARGADGLREVLERWPPGALPDRLVRPAVAELSQLAERVEDLTRLLARHPH